MKTQLALLGILAFAFILAGCVSQSQNGGGTTETSTTLSSATSTTMSSITTTTDPYASIEDELNGMDDENMSDLENEITK